MTLKNRLKKLEKLKSNSGAFFEHCHFSRTIDGDKCTYQMGAAGSVREVDEDTYNRALAKYAPLAEAHGIPSETVIMYAKDGDA